MLVIIRFKALVGISYGVLELLTLKILILLCCNLSQSIVHLGDMSVTFDSTTWHEINILLFKPTTTLCTQRQINDALRTYFYHRYALECRVLLSSLASSANNR